MNFDKKKCIEILSIAWPLIIANSFWNLQITIDRIFLGMYSTEALGASMAVMSIFWTPMALLQQTSSYVTTFVSQYLGAKTLNQIGPSLLQSMYVSIVGGMLFLIMILFSESFFKFVGHSESVMNLEIQYFNSICYSALPMALVASFSGYYTGISKTKMVMLINFVGLIANIILDYALIFGNLGFKSYGVPGAGYATTIASYFSVLAAIIIIIYSKDRKAHNILYSFKPDFSMMKRYLKYGFPSGLQWALEGLAFTVFLILIGRFENGEAALAASSIGVTIMMLSVLPAIGVAQAVMAKVGENLGDGRPDISEKYAWAGVQVSAMYMTLAGLSFFIFPEFYINWFKNDQNPILWAEVSVFATTILMLIAIYTAFDSIYLNLSFALKGAGDTRFVSIVALLVPWPLMVLPTYLLRHHVDAVFYAWAFTTLYSMVTVSIIFLRFRSGRWKSMSVIND